MEPLISIITPVYNSEKYIQQCIESVLSQTHTNWELILIDDCSKDTSVDIISKYLFDFRIKLFKNKNNLGPALTRNVGLDNATGDYITFLDSDDFWSKQHLENQLRFMIDNNLQISHGNYHFCDLEGNIIKSINVTPKIDYFCLLKGNQFKTMSMMLSKDLIGNHRFENIKHEDYAFFLECLKRTNYSLTDHSSIDSYCRIGSGVSVSSNKIKSAVWTWDIYHKHQKLGVVRSCYYFIHYAYNGFMKYR
ncbi:glycosyltransferase family 2 protein [Pasteurellaceae bacterium 22721_9_1]